MTTEPEQLDLVIAVNRKNLIDFFDQGAPHYDFGMSRGLVVSTYHAEEVPQTCGTAGCIAGAAFIMWLKTLEPKHRADVLKRAATTARTLDPKEDPTVEFDYTMVRDGALEFLGLELTQHDGWMQFGHPLFSPGLAPAMCTAAQAAEALRRTFDGEAPWPKA